jgi:low molecular weight phosphotyrosine protein phosphatase
MAEAVFRHLTPSHPRIAAVDSAGTGAYHVGADPDPRTQDVLLANGITTYAHAARTVVHADFRRFDYILGMDRDNVNDLLRLRRRVERDTATEDGAGDGRPPATVMLFGQFGGRGMEEVVDPYYGADDGFEVAFEQMLRFSRGFLREVLGEGEAPIEPKAVAGTADENSEQERPL